MGSGFHSFWLSAFPGDGRQGPSLSPPVPSSTLTKIFEEDGGGLEGEGETFFRKFPLPPPVFSLPPPSELPLVAHPDGDALAVEIFEKRDDVLAGKAAGKLLEPGGIEIVM